MSLILDALNRARDDVNPVPGLATHHRVEQVAANRRQYLLWVALSVAVVMIAWLIVERYSAPRPAGDDVDAVASVAQPPPREPASDPVGMDAVVESLPAAAVSVARLEAQEQSQEQSQVAADAGTSPPAVTELAAQAEALPESGFDAEPVQAYSPEENAEVARLYSNPPKEEPVVQRDSRSAARKNDATAGSSGEQKSIDIDRILREAREEVENASLPDHPVPFLIDLSQQVKDSIPTVYYLRHDYSNNASLSTVVLNSKTLSVGGSPVPGMKIEEILPDSVVLNYQGTQFRLRALNSWVNL
jgi:hypothetical protein